MSEITNNNKSATKCAWEVIRYLQENDLFMDVSIYADGHRYSADRKASYGVFVEEDMDPHDYFEYCGDFLSMSFEGDLYGILNMNYSVSLFDKVDEDLNAIFKKYGYYYELGNAWNLSLYKLPA